MLICPLLKVFYYNQESKVMFCGGHVGRAHGKKLQEYQGKCSFSKAFIDMQKHHLCVHK